MSAYDAEQLDRLDPAYLANYGLTQAPFSNQHDDRFLYLDAERAQRLNLLQHMTQYSNLLLIVLGEEGVGKTSLLTRFITTKSENWHICQVTANTFMDAGQLMFQVAQGFGVHQVPQDSGQLQEMLYSQVATYHHNDQIPILLIDDAHELPHDALMAIFHLADAQVDNASLLRIILFAEPQIEKILNSRDVRPLRERITHTMSIPVLDEDTTGEYLKHRMAVAGFNGGSPFTPKMVRRICKASGGNPARINQLAHETLEKGDFEREEVESIVKPAKPRRLNSKSLAVIAVAIIAIAVLVFQNRINRLFEGKSSKTTTLPLPVSNQKDNAPAKKSPAPVVAGQLAGADQKPEAAGSTPPAPTGQETSAPADQGKLQEKIIPLHAPVSKSPAQTAKPLPPPEQKAVASQLPETKASPAAQPDKQMASTAQAAPSSPAQHAVTAKAIPRPTLASVTPDPVPASDKPQDIQVHGQGFTAKTRVYVRWTKRDHEIPPARVSLVSDKQLQVRLTVGREHDKWQMHVVNPGDEDSNTLDFHVATPGFRQDRQTDWIKSQPKDNYTLQLFSSYEQKNAAAFIQKHQLAGKARYFASKHNGRTLYSVIYGSYSDKPAAQAASRKLPASLNGIKPWIRPFAGVQASMVAPAHIAKKSKARQAVLPAPDSKVFTTSLPKHGNVEQNESWIWSQDPSYFTLQLLGGRELASIKRLLKRHPGLASHAVYFRTQRNGQNWYAVIYGVYASRQKAMAAIKRLPPALQKSRPWIRPFASIHAELSRSQ